jgi:hypothetical protein
LKIVAISLLLRKKRNFLEKLKIFLIKNRLSIKIDWIPIVLAQKTASATANAGYVMIITAQRASCHIARDKIRAVIASLF